MLREEGVCAEVKPSTLDRPRIEKESQAKHRYFSLRATKPLAQVNLL